MDGFYVAKLKKFANKKGPPGPEASQAADSKPEAKGGKKQKKSGGASEAAAEEPAKKKAKKTTGKKVSDCVIYHACSFTVIAEAFLECDCVGHCSPIVRQQS